MIPRPETERGLFLVIEGIDGAGKTTQTTGLEAFLLRNGIPAIRSKEPTDGPWGMKIRQSAKSGRMTPADELNAFMNDRREHVQKLIEPALAAGKTVILDRYFYSSIAYQSVAGLDHAEVTRMMTAEFPIPDVVILIDVPAEVGRGRVVGRDQVANEFESLDNLRRVREQFQIIAREHANVVVIDGTGTAGRVRCDITRRLLDGVLKRRYCGKAYGCDEPEYCGVRRAGECVWAKMMRDWGRMKDEAER